MIGRLDCSDPANKQALGEIAQIDNENDWVVFGYVPKTNKLRVTTKGSGFEDMIDELSDGKVQYCYWRHMVGGAPKFVYIAWCGEGVDGMMKGNSANHAIDMNNFIKSGAKAAIHVQINARSENDLDKDNIIARLVAAGGSNYDAGAKKQGVSEGAGAVGMGELKEVHNRAIAGTEFVKEEKVYVDKQASDKFWRQNQAQKDEAPAQTGSSLQIDSASRQKFWDEQRKLEEAEKAKQAQQQQSATSRFAVNKQESQAYWDQQKTQPAPSAAPKSAPPKVGGSASALRSKFEQKAQESSKPPVRSAPKKAAPTLPKKAAPTPAAAPPTPAAAPPPTPAVAPPPTPAVAPPPTPAVAPPPTPVVAPPTPEVYAQEEYAQGEYAQEEYTEEYAQEEYAQEEYTEEYAQEEYAQEEYAQEEYAQEEYAQEEYAQEEYAQEEYAQGEYAQEEYAQEEYAQEEHAQEEYAQEEYAQEEYTEEYASEYICQVEATYTYAGERPEDLSFNAGDIINVFEQDGSGWWKGELNGAVGYFPSNFVKSL